MRLHLKNARLMDPAASVDRVTDIWMAGGRVASIDHAPDAFTADRVLDVAGKVVMPGLVDLSAQLREPGFEYRATLESELRAAMAGKADPDAAVNKFETERVPAREFMTFRGY